MWRSSSSLRPGLACISQRRGVTPLVTLMKRCGYIAAKSAKIVSTIRRECSADTPLTLCDATIASEAMRTRRSPFSSISDRRAIRPVSPGKRAPTSSRKRRLIS